MEKKKQKSVSRFLIGVAIGTAIAGLVLVITTGKIMAAVPAVVGVMLLLMVVYKKPDDSK